MQLIIDCIKHQQSTGNYQRNRVVIAKIKNEGEALQEAVELIRTIISECIERNLPLDDAFAALHKATVNKDTLTKKNYEQLIKTARMPKNTVFKQSGSERNLSLLKKIQQEYKK